MGVPELFLGSLGGRQSILEGFCWFLGRSLEVPGGFWVIPSRCTKAKYTIFTKDLNGLRKQRVFQNLQRVAQGRFQTYPEDILEAPGRVLLGARRGLRSACARNRKVLGGPRTLTKTPKVRFSCSLEAAFSYLRRFLMVDLAHLGGI